MSKEVSVGYQIDFANYCPLLMKIAPKRPVGLFFNSAEEGIVASETACTNGGLPGVEKRSDSGFLVHVNPDRIVAYCQGCAQLPEGFEEQIDY